MDQITLKGDAFKLNDGTIVPALAFGLYKVPPTPEGEDIISQAIDAGYRHFDTASLYGNEKILGKCIRESGIDRGEFFVATKVWNDAQRQGRAAVRASVEKSIQELDCGPIDLIYIHWPVPGHFVDTYLELQEVQKGGKIKYVGLSNFGIGDYEHLTSSTGAALEIQPIVNQIEISPFMYRPRVIEYFQRRNMIVAASKALQKM